MDFFVESLLHPNSSENYLKDLIYLQSYSSINSSQVQDKDFLSQYDRQALSRKYDRVESFLIKNTLNLKRNTKSHKKGEQLRISGYDKRPLISGSIDNRNILENINALPAQVHPTQIQKTFEEHEFDYKLHNLLRLGLDVFKGDEFKRRKIVKKPSTILKPCECCGKQSHPRHKCLHSLCQRKCGKVKSRPRAIYHLSSKQNFDSEQSEQDSQDQQIEFSRLKKPQHSQPEQSQYKPQIFEPSEALLKSIDQLLQQPYDTDFTYKIVQIRESAEQKENSNQNNSNNQDDNDNDPLNKYIIVERDKISQVQSKSQVSQSRRNNSIKQVLKSVYSNSQHQASNQLLFGVFTLNQKNQEGEKKTEKEEEQKQKNKNQGKQQNKSKSSNNKIASGGNGSQLQNKTSKKSQRSEMSQNSSDQQRVNQKISQADKQQQSDKQEQQGKGSLKKQADQNQEQEQQIQLSYDSNFKKNVLASKSRGDLQIMEQFQHITMRNRMSSKISRQHQHKFNNHYEDQILKLLNQHQQFKPRERFQSEELVQYDILQQKNYDQLNLNNRQQQEEVNQQVKGLGKGKGKFMGSGLGIFQAQLFMDQESHHDQEQFNMLINRYSSKASNQSRNKQKHSNNKRNDKSQKVAQKIVQKTQNLNEIKLKLKKQEQEQQQLYQHYKGLGHGKGFGMGHGMGMAYEQQIQIQLQRRRQKQSDQQPEDQINSQSKNKK